MCLNFCLTKQPFLTPPYPADDNTKIELTSHRLYANQQTNQRSKRFRITTGAQRARNPFSLVFYRSSLTKRFGCCQRKIPVGYAKYNVWNCEIKPQHFYATRKEHRVCGGVCVCVLTAWHYANKLDLQYVVSSIATEVKIFVVQRGTGECKVFAILLGPR